ncbi:MAG: ComEC/Rec2 family competence protein [Alphaproteobacteria bacterium]|nr:ComEC/Rec2 family competence protein [Alphaproteobacteria bacterium]
MGAGISSYFALAFEPTWAAASAALAVMLAAALAARRARSSAWRMVAALLAAYALGFGLAKVRTESVRAPVLARKIGPVRVDARVVGAEPRGNGSRMVLAPVRIGRQPPDQMPRFVRLSVRARSPVPRPGSWIRVTAVLMPPPGPTMPGDYDFGRWAYFQQFGAVGYLYGRPHAIASLRPARWHEALYARLEDLRSGMTQHVRSIVPGREGVIAAALITGERADIDPSDQEAFRDSGLMHVLSISGLHLALAGGFFFWTVRALLALFPSIVLRFPVKKWAAVAAIAGSTFYLLISGCEAPAVRSWIMLTMMFLAVLVDRPALSMRSVAVAAVIIMLLEPESITEPGCEMSFAAVVGLIALAEWEQANRVAHPDDAPNTLFRRTRRYLTGIAVTSVVAGLATAPIAIFHFDRASPFGIIANLAALPVVGVVIMPMATAAMVLMPFGLDKWPLIAMGKGVGAMMGIAHWVASLPGAGTVVPVWPLASMIAVMVGGLWIALWRQSWRWLGAIPICGGLLGTFLANPPDLLVGRDGQTIAMRAQDGKLVFIGNIGDEYAAGSWLRRAGDGRNLDDALLTQAQGVRCDASGCLAHGRNGTLLAVDRRAEALWDDCAAARVVVTTVPAHLWCHGPALVIDRYDMARAGGVAVWFDEPIRIKTVQGERGRRPWSGAANHSIDGSLELK